MKFIPMRFSCFTVVVPNDNQLDILDLQLVWYIESRQTLSLSALIFVITYMLTNTDITNACMGIGSWQLMLKIPNHSIYPLMHTCMLAYMHVYACMCHRACTNMLELYGELDHVVSPCPALFIWVFTYLRIHLAKYLFSIVANNNVAS